VRRLSRHAKRVLSTLAWMILGAVLAGLLLYVNHMRSRPDLRLWHLVELDEEYRAEEPDASSQDYLKREGRLFDELERAVFAETAKEGLDPLNRFHPQSRVHPERFDRFEHNWNRSVEMKVPEPRGAILLLHGLSDSPYSMRNLAEFFRGRGLYVFALRVPGHGTVPSELDDVEWEDWMAAVRFAARHVRERAGPGGRVFLGGYSNGAALSVVYTLEALEAEALPLPDGLFLFSPAIGVTPLAFLAKWQLALSKLPGLEKLGWVDILPEYDPFKYNSFPTNAGLQIYRLTSEITRRLDHLEREGRVAEFPPVVSYTSVADATVPVRALVERLHDRLPPNGSELVVFDVNREADIEFFLNTDFDANLQAFLARTDLTYDLTFVTNANTQTLSLVARRRAAGTSEWEEQPLPLEWPSNVYSLSHVAIPFAPSDPLYGPGAGDTVTLGNLEARGERGVLTVPIPMLMRLRYNPFFPFLQEHLGEALERHFEAR